MCVKQLLTVNESGYFYVFNKYIGSATFVSVCFENINEFKHVWITVRSTEMKKIYAITVKSIIQS